jgi:alpha-1,6-mannosyltransferase
MVFAVTGLALLVLTAAGVPAFRFLGDNGVVTMAFATGFVTLVATRVAPAADGLRGLALVLTFAVAVRIVVVFQEPFLSSDIYRYIWDGIVTGAGINPYWHPPADPALAWLGRRDLVALVNRADYAVTIYPPVAQLFFTLVAGISESVTVMKLALVATEGVTVVVLIAMLRRLGKPATLVVAYAWHPLTIWEIANNGHVDALMVALAMGGLWISLAQRRRLAGGLLIILAALAKPFAMLALPALWRPWDLRLPALVAATIALAYLPFLSVGWGVLGFLGTGYLNEEGIESGSGFWTLAALRPVLGGGSWPLHVYMAVAAVVTGGLALRAGFRKEPDLETSLRDILAILLAALFFLSPTYPLYFLVLTPFLALVPSAAAWTASLGAILLHHNAGWEAWPFLPGRDAAFNLAFLGALAWTAARRAIPTFRLKVTAP